MLGNIVTGTSVFAPAGMLNELSSGLDVSIRGAALLITFGAAVLCIGSPLTAWLTSRIERRTLLTATLALLALCNAASALAPSGRPPVRRSAACCMRAIGCMASVTCRWVSSRWR
jgi:MFS transporter, DHA1 family, inner membrane transport protein